MEIKQKEDFNSYQEWQNVPHEAEFRQERNQLKRELDELTSRYSTLEREISKEYKNSSSDYKKLERIESEFEDVKAEIKSLKKDLQEVDKAESEAAAERAKKWQQFLNEVAESGYLETLAEQYLQTMQKAKKLNDAVRQWYGYSDTRMDFRVMPPLNLKAFNGDKKREQFEAQLERLEAIEQGDYLTSTLRNQ